MFYVTVFPGTNGDGYAVTNTVYSPGSKAKARSENVVDGITQDEATALVWCMNHPDQLVTLLEAVRSLQGFPHNPLKKDPKYD